MSTLSLIILLAAISSGSPPPVSDALPAKIFVLPPGNFHRAVPPWAHDALGVAARLRADEIDALIESDDPRALGVAIFALSEQHRPDRLLELSRLLDDARPTIPVGVATAMQSSDYRTRDQTVSELLRATYEEWFGVRVVSKHQFDELFDGLDPWADPKPWETRLRRTTDPDALRVLKEEIAALPETLRWQILMRDAASAARYTPDEARAEISRLSPSTRAAIDARAMPVPLASPSLKQNAESVSHLYLVHDRIMAGETVSMPLPRGAPWREKSWTPPDWWKADER